MMFVLNCFYSRKDKNGKNYNARARLAFILDDSRRPSAWRDRSRCRNRHRKPVLEYPAGYREAIRALLEDAWHGSRPNG